MDVSWWTGSLTEMYYDTHDCTGAPWNEVIDVKCEHDNWIDEYVYAGCSGQLLAPYPMATGGMTM